MFGMDEQLLMFKYYAQMGFMGSKACIGTIYPAFQKQWT